LLHGPARACAPAAELGGGAVRLHRHPDRPPAAVRRCAARPALDEPAVGSRHRGRTALRPAPRRRVVPDQHAPAACAGGREDPRRRASLFLPGLTAWAAGPDRMPHVFTIAPGVPFVDALAAGL